MMGLGYCPSVAKCDSSLTDGPDMDSGSFEIPEVSGISPPRPACSITVAAERTTLTFGRHALR
jgi:hypothetical protein